MKIKMILTLTCLLCIVFTCPAQKITAKKAAIGGYKFYQNGRVLKMNELATKVSGNSKAERWMQSAKSKIGISNILTGAGGFLIGWPIGTALGGGEPNWILAAGGAVLAGVGIPLGSRGYSQVREAVRIYNKELEDTSGSQFKPQFHVAASSQGIGLLVKF